ncbi:type II toxin-antitoxin system RelE/ParE family toxin [Patescibacteria group bacterium]|nr:type II toxin-antitoxin system RelE/ParE family toxin [Patescibacteria group bacterium]MCG2695018.1 type II toxin-antitoxin system RelE/ParE family toxin [Candidatus Parcubacteria bacterium]
MLYKVLLDKSADKSLEKINKSDKQIGQKILLACLELKNFSETSAGIKKLHCPFVGFRRRVGRYRILFLVNNKSVEIYKIGLRNNVYKK